ncbi:MAG: RagB/SusD family nutrient uptake outer membrane protein [Salinivirgaceae bacterium]|nr:RagB/SusD family nutrient uptake outer membrane protein [Salinivirgaceae bacterium]
MKQKIFSLLFLTAFIFSCQDDFLDKAPLDSINTDNYPKTAEDVITIVNGAYQPLQWPKLFNMRMWTTDIFAGNSIVGAGGGSDGIETQDLANFVTSSDNQGVLDLWRGPWPGILRCNIILRDVPGLDIDTEIKNRSLGEAYFLRANYYFILVRFFGDVPLLTTPQAPGDDLRPFRTDKAKVYELIISDLENAIELLPLTSSYSQIDIGRASKGSAMGTLAKVYLTLQKWAEVVDLCKQVTALGYSLNPNYQDNFNPLGGNTVESLFEVQYHSDGGYDFWSNENQASWTSTFMGPRGSGMVAGGWGWNQPTQEFVDLYEPGDLRKNVTILYDGCPALDGNEYQSSYSFTGYNVRKFLVPLSISVSFDNSPMNFPVLRYADILLMEAEALNELSKTTEAEAPLNIVRARAGLTGISGLTKENFRWAVLKERRIELAFEGQRWFDIVRINNGQYGLDFLQSIGKSNATSKHLLLPIPQKERDVNPNLTQNPGY